MERTSRGRKGAPHTQKKGKNVKIYCFTCDVSIFEIPSAPQSIPLDAELRLPFFIVSKTEREGEREEAKSARVDIKSSIKIAYTFGGYNGHIFSLKQLKSSGFYNFFPSPISLFPPFFSEGRAVYVLSWLSLFFRRESEGTGRGRMFCSQ